MREKALTATRATLMVTVLLRIARLEAVLPIVGTTAILRWVNVMTATVLILEIVPTGTPALFRNDLVSLMSQRIAA